MKNKAVFLDRDGVLNEEVGDYIMRFEDFKILPHVAKGLVDLHRAGYLLIVITNQGGLAKQLYTEETLAKMHQYMSDELLKAGVFFTDIYFCAHHPVKGNCLCRKPGSLLVEKALSKHNIDPLQSYFIGDKIRDIMCGQAVEVKGILIEPNEDWSIYATQISEGSYIGPTKI
ncbi:MAG: HAD family hydrolase [Bacteroidia bacterium]|nr:HAD family hydrolase [Bacteroidia bacterium]